MFDKHECITILLFTTHDAIVDIIYTETFTYNKLILIFFLVHISCLSHVVIFYLKTCKITCILVYRRSTAVSPFYIKIFINV